MQNQPKVKIGRTETVKYMKINCINYQIIIWHTLR